MKNALESYGRLSFVMLDADIVAVKGTGLVQRLAAHQYWHIHVSHFNIGGTLYYLCSILEGFSRYIVNWDIRESMAEDLCHRSHAPTP